MTSDDGKRRFGLAPHLIRGQSETAVPPSGGPCSSGDRRPRLAPGLLRPERRGEIQLDSYRQGHRLQRFRLSEDTVGTPFREVAPALEGDRCAEGTSEVHPGVGAAGRVQVDSAIPERRALPGCGGGAVTEGSA
jgi:hypothetical protein